MGIILIFAATANFKFSNGMVLMVPNYITYKEALVYITGYIEILVVIGMLVKTLLVPVGWFVIKHI
ncbi:hypothetical protein NAF17_01550 [Mucilaginibacter sp. RB4R14]|uniref:hypothetical protein n=1 Tax=Mucilaginibacter aurantiaciroseus TaxID=2949308 RepID=UPI0020903A6B|nr:hypothetical protein [Mucilaginibacter aurantiaciroseus]MCO5934209.1 hypothetical protein [Mucilaginibacter aurantiaciroseus]